jgi:hypothetical protein
MIVKKEECKEMYMDDELWNEYKCREIGRLRE